MKNLFFFTFILLFGNCKPPQPVDPTQPKLIWKTKLADGLSGSIYPVVGTKSVIYSIGKLGATTEPIVSLNKNTGKKEWEWNDYQLPATSNTLGGGRSLMYSINNKIIFPVSSRNYTIDINTGKTLWQNKGDAATPYIRGIGDVCFQAKANQTTGIDLPYVSKCNINTGQWQTVFTDTDSRDFKPFTFFPLPYIDGNGDTLLVYLKTLYLFPPNEELRSLIYCFNVTKNRMVYKKEVIPAVSQGGGMGQPYIYKDKVYNRYGSKLVCLSILTGDKVWENDLKIINDSFNYFTVAEGKVLAGNGNSKLYCYDSETGKLIWEKEKAIANTNSMNEPSVLNGIMYYVALGKLYAVDIQTGDFLWQFKANTGGSNLFLNQSLTVDPIGKRIYAHDYQNAYCFEAIR